MRRALWLWLCDMAAGRVGRHGMSLVIRVLFFWREGVGGVVVSTEGLEGSGW